MKHTINLKFAIICMVILATFQNLCGQVNPVFQVFPIYNSGFKIRIDGDYTDASVANSFRISYKLDGQSDNEYSNPITIINSAGIIEETLPFNLFSTNLKYDFRVEYDYQGDTYSKVISSSFAYYLPTDGGILHGFNQIVGEYDNQNIYYPHEGVDFRGYGSQVKSIAGGVIVGGSTVEDVENCAVFIESFNTEGSTQSDGVVIEINHVRLTPLLLALFQYINDPATDPNDLGMSHRPSVYPGENLGVVGNHYPEPDQRHVHVGYYSDYPPTTPSNFMNILNIYSDNASKDPHQYNPAILNCNAEPHSYRFSKNSLSSSSTFIEYFSDPIGDNDPSLLYGAVDIAVEAIDKQSSISPWAIPYRMGYRVSNLNESGAWDLAVPMHILYENDEYLLGNGCVIPSGNATNPPHCPAIVEALVDWNPDLTQNQDLFNERPVYIVTNTKGTSGDVVDISRDECWATDARATVTTANGYQEGYEKARCVAEAKFPDGKYKAVVVMDDLVHTGVEAEKEVIVDNFKPYVKAVKVFAINTETNSEVLIYEGKREWEPTTERLEISPASSEVMNSPSRIVGAMNPFLQNVRIEVMFSESMSEDEIPECSIVTASNVVAQYEGFSEEGLYQYSVPGYALSSLYPPLGHHTISIKGKDLAGNDLFGINDQTLNQISIASTDIPVRLSNGNWSTAGPGNGVEDHSHHFKVDFCMAAPEIGGSGPTCISAYFESDVPSTGIDQGETVQFTDLSSGEPTAWQWNFGDGAVSTVQNPQHTYWYPGVYTVSLTVSNAFGSDQHTEVGHVVVNDLSGSGGGGSGLVVAFEPSNSTPLTGEGVYFQNSTYGGTGQVSFLWNFGSGANPATSTAQYPPYVEYATTGQKTITLTATDGSGSQGQHSVEIEVQDGTPDLGPGTGPCIEVEALSGNFAVNSAISFSGNNVSGGSGTLQTTWVVTGPNGATYTAVGVSAVMYFPTAGSYTVHRYVSDLNPNTDNVDCEHTFEIHEQGAAFNIELTASPTSISGQNGWFNLAATYQGDYIVGGNYYWEFSNGSSDFIIMEYITSLDYNSSTDIYSTDLSIMGNVVANYSGQLGPGSWNVRLRIESNGNIGYSNNISLFVGVADQPIAPNIIGLGLWADALGPAQPNNQRKECYYTEAPNLGIGPVISNPLTGYYAGQDMNASDNLNCHNAGGYFTHSDCGQCQYHYFSGTITIDDNMGNSGSLIPSGYPTWWGGPPCPHYGASEFLGKLDLSSYNWNNGPWQASIYTTVGNLAGADDFNGPVTVYRCLNAANAGPPAIHRCPGSSFYLGGTGTEPTIQTGTKGPYTVQWSPTTGLDNPNSPNPLIQLPSLVTGNVDYTVTVTDVFGNTASDVVTLVLIDVEALAGPDINVCVNSSTQIGRPAANGSGGGYEYHWSPSIGLSATDVYNPVFTPTAVGVYTFTVTVTDEFGCTDSDQVTITVSDSHPVVTLGSDIVSCPGGYLTVPISVTGGTGNYVNYEWLTAEGQFINGNTAFQFDAPMQTTMYEVVVLDANGCDGRERQYVIIDQGLSPTTEAEDGVEGCLMGNIPIEATVTGGSGDYTYEWTTQYGTISQTNPAILSTPQGTTCTVVVRDVASGCFSLPDEVFVNVDELLGPVGAVSDGSVVLCYGAAPVEINGWASLSGTPPLSYEWVEADGTVIATGQSIEVSQAMGLEENIFLVLSDSEGCRSAGTAVHLTNDSQIRLYIDTKYYCEGAEIQLGDALQSIYGGTPPYTYSWSHPVVPINNANQLNATAAVEVTTQFKLEAVDALGCQDEDWENRYSLAVVLNLGDNPQFYSDHGHFCTGSQLCVEGSSIVSAVNQDIFLLGYAGTIQSIPYQSQIANDIVNPSTGTSNTNLRRSHSGTWMITEATVNGTPTELTDGCLILNSEGVLTITVAAEREGPHSSTISEECEFVEFTETIYVEPSVVVDEEAFVCEQQNGGADSDVQALSIVVTDGCGPLMVMPEVTHNYIAGEHVKIRPGFSAKNGSRFRAAINPCMITDEERVASGQEQVQGVRGNEKENQGTVLDSLNEVSYKTLLFPNPTNGIFTIINGYSMEQVLVRDAVGRTILVINDHDATERIIDLSAFSTGSYQVRLLLSNGEVEMHRVVRQ